jgi:hypothetical protein
MWYQPIVLAYEFPIFEPFHALHYPHISTFTSRLQPTCPRTNWSYHIYVSKVLNMCYGVEHINGRLYASLHSFICLRRHIGNDILYKRPVSIIIIQYGNHYPKNTKPKAFQILGVSRYWVLSKKLINKPTSKTMYFQQLKKFKSSVFWNIMPCSRKEVNQYFRGMCHLHLQGQRISQARNQHEAGCKQSDMFLQNIGRLSMV